MLQVRALLRIWSTLLLSPQALSKYISDWPQNLCIDQDDERRNPPAVASKVLRLKAFTIICSFQEFLVEISVEL